MKLYAPPYYKKFTCIADKCEHSCCIGWEIDIDPHTKNIYQNLSCEYGDIIRDSIDTYNGTPFFALCDNQKCPHLDERGLCRIITHLGEAYLCDICREHPRFYHNTPIGKEVGLGMACEEACRIILSSDDYADMVVLDEIDEDSQTFAFDPLPYRTKIFEILQDTHLTYPQKVQKLSQIFDVSLEDRDFCVLLNELSYLDEQHKSLLASYTPHIPSKKEWDMPLSRALAYFVYRHVSTADSQSELSASLGFGLFCVQLIVSVAVTQGVEDIGSLADIARMVSEELEYNEENTQAIKFEFLF